MEMIPFNKPYITGMETEYIKEAVAAGKISGDGLFTKKCHQFIERRYGFLKALLTTSCTDALEMAALLLDMAPGDEVIMPSYTFVSTANAFILRGARIIFADSEEDTPNIDVTKIEDLITDKTKAIVPVHYAGIACDMDIIKDLSVRYNLFVVEDAAQAIESYYLGKPLGSLGHLAAFSFHETKNINSGEGGLLAVNDGRFIKRSEIIREKGTNRPMFFRGEIDKYGWVDIGSSFLPSDIIAAYLYAQFENIDLLQSRRKSIWEQYRQRLELTAQKTGRFKIPHIPDYATNNGHMFYLVCDSLETRTGLINYLKANNVLAVFHYQSLHKSQYYARLHDRRDLPNSDRYTDCLMRLPLYHELTDSQVHKICDLVDAYFA